MSVSDLTRTSTRETDGESPPWDSQHEEFDYVVDDIDGEIPQSLRGVLYRIGPGRFEIGGHPMTHIFDGDGMVSRLDISSDGGVHYRNRYVRTRSFKRANETRLPPKGVQHPAGRRSAGECPQVPREHVQHQRSRPRRRSLLPLGGRPTAPPRRRDTRDLRQRILRRRAETLGAFSAHPKIDPRTGEVFNFGLDFFPRPMLRCYRLDKSRRLHSVGTVPIPKLGFVHDFALTERHLVFVLGPLVVSRPIPVALGLRPFGEALSYKPELGTTIVLVPRDGGKATRIETDSLFHFHVANAYEAGPETVVDIVAHDATGGWTQWNNYLCNFRDSPRPGVRRYSHPPAHQSQHRGGDARTAQRTRL